MTCVPTRANLVLAYSDLHPAPTDLCTAATYVPTYAPTAPRYARYVPTYFRAALNIAIPMHKGGSNKTIQANIK